MTKLMDVMNLAAARHDARVAARSSAPWSLRARCPWNTLVHAASLTGTDGLILRCRNEKNALAISFGRFHVDSANDVTCIICIGMDRK